MCVVFLAQKLLVALRKSSPIRIVFLLVKQRVHMVVLEVWVVLGGGVEDWVNGAGGASLSMLLSLCLS